MEVFAKLKHLRIAPRKTRLIADLIRGKSVEEAERILAFVVKRGKEPIKKLLESAVANAKNNFGLNEKNLVVFRIFVDEGSKLKRWMPRARGRAARIEKKTSHITLVLQGEARKEKDGLKSSAAGKEKKKEAKEAVKTAKSKLKPRWKERYEVKSAGGLKRSFRRKAF